jgi:heme exporter protein A
MIETLKLEKSYGARNALRSTTLTIETGQVVVLAGPNGAGKSTLLRVLATLAKQTKGRAAINRIEIPEGAMQVRAAIGYVGHYTLLYDELSVYENLKYYARLYNVSEIEQRISEVAQQVGIERRLNDTVRTLSRGYQQRAALGRALIHRPTVLLFDEPWTGLDQSSSTVLTTIFEQSRASGGTVLFSSHEFERSLDSADRALVMRNGRIIYDGNKAEWGDSRGFTQIYANELDRAAEEAKKPRRRSA